MSNTPEEEKQLRGKVLVWAYAYEIASYGLVSDAVFDATCKQINVNVLTGNEEMDNWFKENFQPYTGMWIHKLPEKFKQRIHRIVAGIIREEAISGSYL